MWLLLSLLWLLQFVPVFIEVVTRVRAGVHKRTDSPGQLTIVFPAREVEPENDAETNRDGDKEQNARHQSQTPNSASSFIPGKVTNMTHVTIKYSPVPT